MATVNRDKKGMRVLYFDEAGDRKTLRLTGCNKQQAAQVGRHVDALVRAKMTAQPVDRQTSIWITEIGPRLYQKLSERGLVAPRVTTTLAEFLNDYLARRNDVKSGTRTNYEQVRWNLLAHFGEGRLIRSITPIDAVGFREWLLTDEGLSENTVRRRCGRARQFFTDAIKRGLVEKNPFEGIPVTVGGNEEKRRFVSRSEATRILDACPNTEWRIIFALCRFGGLRCPSEVLLLKWSDVDWVGCTVRVTSPKTERHAGHGFREIPLFPDLADELMKATEGVIRREGFVVTRYRSSNQNLRTELNRILKRAGIAPWPKPFQNLRSTRETELMEEFPSHVVCAWIGNSEAVARKHYLQITDAHFEKATRRSVAQSVAQ